MTNKYPVTCIVCGKKIVVGEGIPVGYEYPGRLRSKLVWQHKKFCMKGPKIANK